MPRQLEPHGAIAYRATSQAGGYDLTITLDHQGEAKPSSVQEGP